MNAVHATGMGLPVYVCLYVSPRLCVCASTGNSAWLDAYCECVRLFQLKATTRTH